MTITAILFSLFPLVLFYNSIKDFLHSFRLKKHGILTEGEVENLTIETDSEGDKSYRLIVKFKTIEGNLFQNVVSKTDTYYHEGLKIHVLYDPENPLDFLVNDPKASSEMEGAVIGFLFGILLAILIYFSVEHPEFVNND
jgi:Protein of unknown function (DUF3592)